MKMITDNTIPSSEESKISDEAEKKFNDVLNKWLERLGRLDLMISIDDYTLPSPDQWRFAIQGMRNPRDSWDMSDSELIIYDSYSEGYDTYNINKKEINDTLSYNNEISDIEEMAFYLGEADKKLLLNLCRSGSEHRKVLRQLDVGLRITAPLYFWKQIDAYKVGITMNSCSTMHTITKKEFELSDFSYDNESIPTSVENPLMHCETADIFMEETINNLNALRERYLETKDYWYWKKIIEFLPESYNQTRNIVVNCEWIINYIFQRRWHKLPEHDVLCSWFIVNVPLVKEIVEAIEGKS